MKSEQDPVSDPLLAHLISMEPLSAVFVQYIESQEGGLEEIGQNVIFTKKGHAGTVVVFSIIEIGDGSNSPVAELNSQRLRMTSLSPYPDPATGIAIGLKKLFQYSGPRMNGGRFKYSNYPNGRADHQKSCILQIMANN